MCSSRTSGRGHHLGAPGRPPGGSLGRWPGSVEGHAGSRPAVSFFFFGGGLREKFVRWVGLLFGGLCNLRITIKVYTCPVFSTITRW